MIEKHIVLLCEGNVKKKHPHMKRTTKFARKGSLLGS